MEYCSDKIKNIIDLAKSGNTIVYTEFSKPDPEIKIYKNNVGSEMIYNRGSFGARLFEMILDESKDKN